jgi:hypothetical protein
MHLCFVLMCLFAVMHAAAQPRSHSRYVDDGEDIPHTVDVVASPPESPQIPQTEDSAALPTENVTSNAAPLHAADFVLRLSDLISHLPEISSPPAAAEGTTASPVEATAAATVLPTSDVGRAAGNSTGEVTVRKGGAVAEDDAIERASLFCQQFLPQANYTPPAASACPVPLEAFLEEIYKVHHGRFDPVLNLRSAGLLMAAFEYSNVSKLL